MPTISTSSFPLYLRRFSALLMVLAMTLGHAGIVSATGSVPVHNRATPDRVSSAAAKATSTVESSAPIAATQSITTTQTSTSTRGSGVVLPGLSELKPKESAAEQPAAEEAAPPAADEAAGPVDTLADVRDAVVQIEAVGTFMDPAEGLQMNAAGRGSGFIIDPSGIAVTNNHVVTGGGLYKVYVAGEDEPRSAKVLGVSECADLAVIDIQGDGFRYLDWHEGPIKVGLDVYAAGFPLGDPEYTLTRGIVAKERANGKTAWASVTKVLQHDADINPGNSGGPLVDSDGHVVGINYAGNSNTNQYFAISRDEATPLIDRLRAGENVDTIGINGEAVNDGEKLSGIWVSSVKSGSPADKVGIRAGDIIMSMEGITLAEDGSMATYCDILRSHGATDVLSLQVLRFSTKEVMEGQINGRELAQSFSFADQLDNQSAGGDQQTTAPDAPATYSGYTTVADDNGILALEVPVEWKDVQTTDWVWKEETVGIRLVATTDLDSVFKSWGTPGVIFNVSSSLAQSETPKTMLDAVDYSEVCTNGGRKEIPDGFYTGYYDLWTDCDNGQSRAVIVSVAPETQDYIVLFEIYIAGEADIEALDHILDSFVVTLPSATGSNQDASSSGDIFDLVDVSGLTYDYVFVDEPALSAIIPADWSDVASNDWLNDNDEVLGKTLAASTSIQGFNDNWTTAGIYVRTATDLEEELDINDLLDSVDMKDTCTYDDRYKHEHTIYGITYAGAYDLYTKCGGEDNAFAYLVVQSDDLKQAVLLEFVAITDADVEAFKVLLQSFYVGDGAGANSESAATDSSGIDYTVLNDESGSLAVRVPVAWGDTSSGDWILDDKAIGVSLYVSTDLDQYRNTWTTPGMFFGASKDFAGADTKAVLDALDYSENCKSSERFEYDDSVFVGNYDLWEKCGGSDSLWVVLAAEPKESADYLVLLNVLIDSSTSPDVLDEIFKSFNVEWQGDAGQSAQPTAEVVTDALNIRSGPGTNYSRIGGVNRGDQLRVIGQADDCAWLNVQTRDEVTGWVSGSSRYVTLKGDCADIPAVAAPPPAQGNSGGAPRPATGKGCYTFQNQLGAELNVTFTRPSDNWNMNFKVAAGSEKQQCFDPGRYTYTLDAPPPWGSTNGEMTISAGDNYLFPVRPAD